MELVLKGNMRIEAGGSITLFDDVTITAGDTTITLSSPRHPRQARTGARTSGRITEGYENSFTDGPSANAVRSSASLRYFFIHVDQGDAKITPPPDGYPDPLPSGYIIRVNDGGINIIDDPVNPPDPPAPNPDPIDPDPQTPGTSGGGGCNAAGAGMAGTLILVSALLNTRRGRDRTSD